MLIWVPISSSLYRHYLVDTKRDVSSELKGPGGSFSVHVLGWCNRCAKSQTLVILTGRSRFQERLSVEGKIMTLTCHVEKPFICWICPYSAFVFLFPGWCVKGSNAEDSIAHRFLCYLSILMWPCTCACWCCIWGVHLIIIITTINRTLYIT